jgi:hypothetical protein
MPSPSMSGRAAHSERQEEVVKSGSCMCGAVTFRVSCALKPPDACHCTQCRKFSGHYAVGTDVARSAFDISGAENITWYYTSLKVRRGFCARCGCSMFFDPPAQNWIGISMGAFDGATDTHTALHIFVAEKEDYYEITDGLQQYPRIPQQ